MHVDRSRFAPVVERPADVDLADYESEQLENLRSSFLGRWRDSDGDVFPFITNVAFESVELEGAFPDCAVVATFRSTDRPGVLFARSWPLYDELGSLSRVELADIELIEEIEAIGHGLPPTDHCVPAANGLVWF